MAGSLEKFMTLTGSGTINHEQHFFIARNLTTSKLPNPDGEDSILGLVEVTPTELRHMIISDQLKWSMSTLGMFRLFETLR